jgi:hypothetical protein
VFAHRVSWQHFSASDTTRPDEEITPFDFERLLVVRLGYLRASIIKRNNEERVDDMSGEILEMTKLVISARNKQMNHTSCYIWFMNPYAHRHVKDFAIARERSEPYDATPELNKLQRLFSRKD